MAHSTVSSTLSFQRKKVRTKEPFGKRLLRLREHKGLTLAAVEDEIKIREHHLVSIEASHFFELPHSHARGFIRRYARFLGLDDNEIEAELVHLSFLGTTKSLFSPSKVGSEPRWIITPRTIGIGLGIMSLIAVVVYIGLQVNQFAAPPELIVESPKDQEVVTTQQLTVRGSTDPGSTVTIDDVQANVDTAGAFTFESSLRPGLNQITIRSVNRIEKQSIKVITLLYDVSQASPSPSP